MEQSQQIRRLINQSVTFASVISQMRRGQKGFFESLPASLPRSRDEVRLEASASTNVEKQQGDSVC